MDHFSSFFKLNATGSDNPISKSVLNFPKTQINSSILDLLTNVK
jgi:hypothetical protein